MKILVVGDSCKDVFIYGDITRLTPEAPVPVFNPLRKTENDGMARNVSNNVEALNVGIYTITNPNSIKKIRYVDHKSNQLVLRVDEHDYCDRMDNMVLSTIQNNKCHVFVDTKKQLGSWIENADFIKINELEYENNEEFLNEYYGIMDKTIVTKGNKGCLYKDKIYPTEDVPVKDISGAGDTFLAGLVVQYLKTNNMTAAIEFAQKCTKSVVQKHGVSTI